MSSSTLHFRVGVGPKGRGLFATRTIPPRTLVHEAPCLRVTKAEYDLHMQHTLLEHYLFNAKDGNNPGDKLLALGYGSLFNHSSSRPNVDYQVDANALCIRYISGHAEIQTGEELCISYGGRNLWFDNASAKGGTMSSQSSLSSDGKTDDDGMALFLANMEL